MTKVLREGALQVVPARDLVPGDRIELEAGDNVPADARLIEAFGLRVQEAALTGESAPEEKNANEVLSPEAPLGDRRNMAYMGTVVSAGRASALVVATGMNTELGHIAGLLQRSEPEPTPLQKRLAELGRVLAIACLGIVALVFGLELLEGGNLFEVFLLSVSLAVAAVPEGLPAVVTIALALGLQRMIRRNALIRRLPSVETLGSVTVICSDKTGTLTKNEMTVREIFAGGQFYHVTGAGYVPRGDFLQRPRNAKQAAVVMPANSPDLLQALRIGVHCNNASVQPHRKGGDAWQVIGDPTEGALLVVGLKAGLAADKSAYPVLIEIPFDSERKAMSVAVRESNGQVVLFTKGAAEVILDKCESELRDGHVVPLSAVRRKEILQLGAGMAGRALRVLALAYRHLAPHENPGHVQETRLVFAGLMGMIDPPREEAREAVHKCHEAGIRPVMITGDHPATALAIAGELNIARGLADRVVTGLELNAWSDDELVEQVKSIAVYARVSAEHKLRIVRAWKKNGEVVAMTGDGVNDAPALKAADIGIAMGITGTDVTKEASAMVLTDDNFASIINAVEEGRGIFDNIQKVLQYLLSCNFGEILLVLLTSLLGWPAPVIPVQLLWINLVTDGLPALALALEPPEPGIMRRRPRPPGESILSWRLGARILLNGALVGMVSLAAFGVLYLNDPENLGRARTMAFCVLVYAELLRALAARSQHLTLFEIGWFTNPHLLGAIGVSALLQLSIVTMPYARPIFESVSHFWYEWPLMIGLAVTPLIVIELTKLVHRRLIADDEHPRH
jgi:Ca2+-transporting ATPase